MDIIIVTCTVSKREWPVNQIDGLSWGWWPANKINLDLQ